MGTTVVAGHRLVLLRVLQPPSPHIHPAAHGTPCPPHAPTLPFFSSARRPRSASCGSCLTRTQAAAACGCLLGAPLRPGQLRPPLPAAMHPPQQQCKAAEEEEEEERLPGSARAACRTHRPPVLRLMLPQPPPGLRLPRSATRLRPQPRQAVAGTSAPASGTRAATRCTLSPRSRRPRLAAHGPRRSLRSRSSGRQASRSRRPQARVTSPCRAASSSCCRA